MKPGPMPPALLSCWREVVRIRIPLVRPGGRVGGRGAQASLPLFQPFSSPVSSPISPSIHSILTRQGSLRCCFLHEACLDLRQDDSLHLGDVSVLSPFSPSARYSPLPQRQSLWGSFRSDLTLYPPDPTPPHRTQHKAVLMLSINRYCGRCFSLTHTPPPQASTKHPTRPGGSFHGSSGIMTACEDAGGRIYQESECG